MVKTYLDNHGTCIICGTSSRFIANDPWLRDHYRCLRCNSIPRQRALIEVLNICFPAWRSSKIHESSPSNDFLLRTAPAYSFSFFLDEVLPGQRSRDGLLCQNLESLTFPDENFDVFVTQDVLEHVVAPDKALAEIMRVLVDGGIHIFTAPKHKYVMKSYARVERIGDQIGYLHEPTYHGNPIGDGKSLVTWDYGADFEDLVRKWSGYCTSTYVLNDRRRGLDGEYMEVFVTVKDSTNRLGGSNDQSDLH